MSRFLIFKMAKETNNEYKKVCQKNFFLILRIDNIEK